MNFVGSNVCYTRVIGCTRHDVSERGFFFVLAHTHVWFFCPVSFLFSLNTKQIENGIRKFRMDAFAVWLCAFMETYRSHLYRHYAYYTFSCEHSYLKNWNGILDFKFSLDIECFFMDTSLPIIPFQFLFCFVFSILWIVLKIVWLKNMHLSGNK